MTTATAMTGLLIRLLLARGVRRRRLLVLLGLADALLRALARRSALAARTDSTLRSHLADGSGGPSFTLWSLRTSWPGSTVARRTSVALRTLRSGGSSVALRPSGAGWALLALRWRAIDGVGVVLGAEVTHHVASPTDVNVDGVLGIVGRVHIADHVGRAVVVLLERALLDDRAVVLLDDVAPLGRLNVIHVEFDVHLRARDHDDLAVTAPGECDANGARKH
jgi:hypothetical protein